MDFAAEPFLDQYPRWAQPGFNERLYYHPSVGYSCRPLYSASMPDGKPAIVCYRSSQTTENDSEENRPHHRPNWEPVMISIYNGEEYIGKIWKPLLKRFSGTAMHAFPTVPRSTPDADGVVCTTIDDPANPSGGPSWQDNESSVSDHFTVDSTRSRSTSESQSMSTSITTPAATFCTPAISVSLQQEHSSSNNELTLSLESSELPSTSAIQEALSWMRHNVSVAVNDKLSGFPSNLHSPDIWGLVDLYQAALAFDMRPFPNHLRRRIIDYISSCTPDADMLHKLSRYLPVRDVIIDHLIHTIEDRRRQRVYTNTSIQAIDHVFFSEGNEDLAEVFREISIHRAQEWQQHNRYRWREVSPTHGPNRPPSTNSDGRDNIFRSSRRSTVPVSTTAPAPGCISPPTIHEAQLLPADCPSETDPGNRSHSEHIAGSAQCADEPDMNSRRRRHRRIQQSSGQKQKAMNLDGTL